MPKPLLPAVASVALVLASCTPPEPVPPPRFRPNPPYPPQQVDPYGQPADPYAQNPDAAPSTPQGNPPEIPTRPGEYPTAKLTPKPNVVISPYEPFNEVDVSDYKPGELARDPYNKKIFRVP